jgi:hypothetical protein
MADGVHPSANLLISEERAGKSPFVLRRLARAALPSASFLSHPVLPPTGYSIMLSVGTSFPDRLRSNNILQLFSEKYIKKCHQF